MRGYLGVPSHKVLFAISFAHPFISPDPAPSKDSKKIKTTFAMKDSGMYFDVRNVFSFSHVISSLSIWTTMARMFAMAVKLNQTA